MTRAHVALALLTELAQSHATRLRRRLPTLLHAACLALDASHAFVFDHARRLLLLLLQSLVLEPCAARLRRYAARRGDGRRERQRRRRRRQRRLQRNSDSADDSESSGDDDDDDDARSSDSDSDDSSDDDCYDASYDRRAARRDRVAHQAAQRSRELLLARGALWPLEQRRIDRGSLSSERPLAALVALLVDAFSVASSSSTAKASLSSRSRRRRASQRDDNNDNDVDDVDDGDDARGASLCERWTRLALHAARTATPAHVVCRSHQIYRALARRASVDDVASLLSALHRATLQATQQLARVDVQLELLASLRVAIARVASPRALLLVPHAHWSLVALLDSEYAVVFNAAARALCTLLARSALDDSHGVGTHVVLGALPAAWRDATLAAADKFVGVQPLALRGLVREATERAALALWLRLLHVSSDELVQADGARTLVALVGALPTLCTALAMTATTTTTTSGVVRDRRVALEFDASTSDVDCDAASLARALAAHCAQRGLSKLADVLDRYELLALHDGAALEAFVDAIAVALLDSLVVGRLHALMFALSFLFQVLDEGAAMHRDGLLALLRAIFARLDLSDEQVAPHVAGWHASLARLADGSATLRARVARLLDTIAARAAPPARAYDLAATRVGGSSGGGGSVTSSPARRSLFGLSHRSSSASSSSQGVGSATNMSSSALSSAFAPTSSSNASTALFVSLLSSASASAAATSAATTTATMSAAVASAPGSSSSMLSSTSASALSVSSSALSSSQLLVSQLRTRLTNGAEAHQRLAQVVEHFNGTRTRARSCVYVCVSFCGNA